MRSNNLALIKILIGITITSIVFHLLILIKIIPYEITWGGRLKNDEEMYVFESFSIIISLFFNYVLLQKGGFVRRRIPKKILSLILWVFLVLFALNTMGNLFAKTMLEQGFAFITLTNSVLLWCINTSSED